jgi:NADH:ubiquinone reductase (H+-translocating)
VSLPHVVIIGGGFGGLAAAQGLRKAPVRITVIDRRNHHLFQPLLYQVATAALSPSDIAEPIRSVLANQPNASVRLAPVEGIDLAAREVQLADGTCIAYDHLIVAAGVSHSYFGHPEWAQHAPGLKSIRDALEIRRRLLCAFEEAEWTTDPALREALTTFIVVGGGPTGVELAGALAEVAMRTLPDDFRNVDTTKARILLLEGGPHLLSSYPEGLRDKARKQLESLGVVVRTNTLVSHIDAQGVTIGDERIPSHVILWAAGVQGSALAKQLDVPLNRAGQVSVLPDLSIPGHPEVFVIGDLARLVRPDGSPVPGVAQGALQMGTFAAKAIRADLASSPRGAFAYWDKGSMATIGRSRAVMDAMGIRIGGLFAWLAWATVHLFFLVGFRNRFVVFLKWWWAWLTADRASRLLWQGEDTDPTTSHKTPSS